MGRREVGVKPVDRLDVISDVLSKVINEVIGNVEQYTLVRGASPSVI